MSRRLPLPASLRGNAVELSIAGTTVRGFAGESLATAAWAQDVRTLSRSIKYHRPRGAFCLEGHCSGCLMRIGGIPNQRACQVPCRSGTVAEPQNAFPSAELDVLGAFDLVFARGMDHHTLATSSSVVNAVARRVVRQLSGLGTLPDRANPQTPAVDERRVQVAVVGGGAAGLAAAAAAAAAGVSTLLLDDQLALGGSLRADPAFGPAAAQRAIDDALAAGVELLPRTTAIGYFPEDAGGVLVAINDERAYRVVAEQWIWATGGYPVNLPLGDNDRPGVLALRAGLRLLLDHGVLAGDSIAIVAEPAMRAEAERAAAALEAAGAAVRLVPCDQARTISYRGELRAVELADGTALECDCVLVAAVPSPASEGPRQMGCAVILNAAHGGFAVQVDAHGKTNAPRAWACGDVCGYQGAAAARAHGAAVGAACAAALRPDRAAPDEAPR